MPNRIKQEPVATEKKTPAETTKYSHPAYAMVSANRVHGSSILYGSDFRHQGYIRVAISPSVLQRSLSTDWPTTQGRPLVEFDMSEAQWAHFVSSLNVGMGTQCTLSSRDGHSVPRLPEPTERQAQFAGESAARMERAKQSLADLATAIAQSGLSKTKQADLLRAVRSAQSDIGGNQEFVADRFAEHMETVVQHAKVEVDAYVQGAMRYSGSVSLPGDAISPPRIDVHTARTDICPTAEGVTTQGATVTGVPHAFSRDTP